MRSGWTRGRDREGAGPHLGWGLRAGPGNGRGRTRGRGLTKGRAGLEEGPRRGRGPSRGRGPGRGGAGRGHLPSGCSQVSQAAAELLAFCETHAKDDPLVTPVPAAENPFRDKRLFCVLL